jgi:hypothetical protein
VGLSVGDGVGLGVGVTGRGGVVVAGWVGETAADGCDSTRSPRAPSPEPPPLMRLAMVAPEQHRRANVATPMPM